MNDQSNADLALRIRDGDPKAEEALIERFGRGVSVIIRRVLRNRTEAEDLCQETFRIALEKIRQGSLREPAKLPGFMSGLARNLALDWLRRQTRRKTEGVEDIEQETGRSNPNQLNLLLNQEMADTVRQVIRELATERDRQLLFRYYISEEDKSAICLDLGLSSLHFNRVLHRARQRYKKLYERRANTPRRGDA